MPSPPLPMLRNSERTDFKRCPQRWWWSWRDGLYEAGPPAIALWFGTGWHLVMAHHYGKPGLKRGANPLKVWRDWVGDEIPKIRVNLRGDQEYKEEVYIDALALGERMIGNYIDRWGKDSTWHMIQVERPFEVVIMSEAGERRVLFCGTYDGVYRDLKDDSIWLLEHKTAKAISLGHLTLDDQGGSYFLVASRDLRHDKLIGPKENLRGIMYNFARKAPGDDRPRNAQGLALNKDGQVSKQQPSPLFVRHPVTRTMRERNSMVRRIQAEVEHMTAMKEGVLPIYKTPTKDCSWGCKFYEMCVMHESGGPDWEEYRDNIFKVCDPYQEHRKSAQAGDD